MTRSLRPGRRLAIALVTAVIGVWLVGPAGATPGSASAASRWTGGIDLYRDGSFTTQQSWLWCTAADVQLIRNIARKEHDHSTSGQRRSFSYMRSHNRYDIPVSDGVDPAGWTAGLRHYVDSRYQLVASGSFDAALKSAVTNLRKTNLPIGIAVAHGNHAWVLTGFTATADPAVTSRFTVTSVRVTGPLWGLQSRSYGYDMRPDMKLTPKQLAGFFSPWHYAGVRMAWEGRWVSIQPIPKAAAAKAPTSSARPSATSAAPASAAPPSQPPSPSPSTIPAIAAAPTAARSTEIAPAAGSNTSASAPVTESTTIRSVSVGPASVAIVLLASALLLGAWRVAVRRRPG